MTTYEAPATTRWDTAYYLRVLRAIGAAEYKLKYSDSVLGYAWSILKPLAWFAVLFVVFGRFFKLQGGFEHYGVYLLVGIVLWTFFLDSTMPRSPRSSRAATCSGSSPSRASSSRSR